MSRSFFLLCTALLLSSVRLHAQDHSQDEIQEAAWQRYGEISLGESRKMIHTSFMDPALKDELVEKYCNLLKLKSDYREWDPHLIHQIGDMQRRACAFKSSSKEEFPFGTWMLYDTNLDARSRFLGLLFLKAPQGENKAAKFEYNYFLKVSGLLKTPGKKAYEDPVLEGITGQTYTHLSEFLMNVRSSLGERSHLLDLIDMPEEDRFIELSGFAQGGERGILLVIGKEEPRGLCTYDKERFPDVAACKTIFVNLWVEDLALWGLFGSGLVGAIP